MRPWATLLSIAAAATLVLPASAAAPRTAAELAAAFGARESVQQISLSPDGKQVAIVMATTGRGAALMIADLVKGGTPTPVLTSKGDTDRITDCHWSTDTRIVCRLFLTTKAVGDRLSYTRLLALDSNGANLKMLSAPTGYNALGFAQEGGQVIDWLAENGPGGALMTRMFVPEYQTGTRLANQQQGLGVERVDTSTLKRQMVEAPRSSAVEYISDGRGTVRVMGLRPPRTSGYAGNEINYLYRKKGTRDWLPLGKLTLNAASANGFNPYAVDSAADVVYGFDDDGGRAALFKIALDGSLKRELVMKNPDVDVDDLVRVGRQGRVVGASFATESRQTTFFDPELRRLQASLGKAIPSRPFITFVDASADEGKLLLFAGSDTDPGMYYVYDKATRQLGEVLPARPELAEATTARMTPVTFPAADGTKIPGYLTLPAGSSGKGLPAIVMPHGGPGARDELGFDWLAQFFAARGFAVLQPNFRGSTGYGSAWFQKNGFQSWRTAVGDVNDAGRWLAAQGIAAPGKLAIVGWSYGGYAALQSAALDADLYKAIVAIAPVTDLDMLREESRNYMNFVQVDRFIGNGAHVREGSPARNAGKIKAPVLLFHGTEDANVGIAESRIMADHLKDAGRKAELIEFRGLDHQLDDATARTAMLARADAFLRTSLALPPN